MPSPQLSAHFKKRAPSAIRLAQIEFAKRKDGAVAVNTAIGNVSLPMHPAMQKRMRELGKEGSPFAEGVVAYTSTVGTDEARQAFKNIIASSGCETQNLHVQITDGGSAAMELMILGVCGPAGTTEKPLLLIDAAYTNYMALAERVGRSVISVTRSLGDSGKFNLPDLNGIREIVKKRKPGALVVIPYDNPTGHFCDHETMVELAKICVEENLWMVSDEAYRELHYTGQKSSSVWAITESEAPGIIGRRISIESASKVWNACGLRIGALVTDNLEFHEKAVAENTANLCSSAIGQYIFGALAHESRADLEKWFERQRNYYRNQMEEVSRELKKRLPDLIVSSPDASIYTVVDVRRIAKPGFSAMDFVLHCARRGGYLESGKKTTLLVSPMSGFYNVGSGKPNPGQTQMRIAYVLTPQNAKRIAPLFEKLFKEFESQRKEK